MECPARNSYFAAITSMESDLVLVVNGGVLRPYGVGH